MSELVKVEPAAMIQMALSQGQDLDKLEKLLELQIRYDEREAKKAFHEAMAQFKANPPEIEKDRSVAYKQTKYSHASLANVTKKINVGLSAFGLSATWATDQDTGNITVTCTITHKQGHSENTSLTAGPDDSGSKNKIQAIGSTISYLERYTILALTGLATHDMDTDGITGDIEYITTDQQIEIHDAVAELYADNGKQFLSWLRVDSVEAIPASQYKKAIQGLSDIRKAGK
jgi:hypothetical protein